MTLEELESEFLKDSKMDDTSLDIESLKIPQLYGKYLTIHNRWNLLLKQSESEHRKLLRSKWEYYTGKADAKVYQQKPFDLKVLKQDVDLYIQSDEEVIESNLKIEYRKTMVEKAEKACKMINNRGFQIKNAVDWKRFMDGAL